MSKPALSVAILGRKPEHDEDETPPDSSDDVDPDAGLHAGAEALLKAIEDGDADAVVDAFKSMHKLCAEP